MGGSGTEGFVEDGADVVAEAAGPFAEVLEAVNDPRIHTHAAHDQKRTAIKGWDVKMGLPPQLDPSHGGGGVFGHVEIGGDEVGGACGEVVEGDLVFDEIGQGVVDGAVASDDDEAVIGPELVVFGLVVCIENVGRVAPRFEELFALVGELGGLVSAGFSVDDDADVHGAGLMIPHLGTRLPHSF